MTVSRGARPASTPRAERGSGSPTSESPASAASPSVTLSERRAPSWAVSGRRECTETETTMPASMRLAMTDEPPYETKGMGFPESGKMPMTPATLSSIWITTSVVQPAAMSLPARSGACSAILNPAHAKSAKPASRPSVPTSPHSSPMTAKMKSLCAMGR